MLVRFGQERKAKLSKATLPSTVTVVRFAISLNAPNLISSTFAGMVREVIPACAKACSPINFKVEGKLTDVSVLTPVTALALILTKPSLRVSVSTGEYLLNTGPLVSPLSTPIPRSVTSIERGAFRMCKSLKNITISKGVRKIGDGAFYGCGSLTNITIPKSVTSIGGDAFGNCKLLESAVVLGDVWLNICSNCKSLKTIVAPKTAVRHSAVYYRGFLENIELFDEKKKAAYIKGMLSHQDIAVEALSGGRVSCEGFKLFVESIKPEGELFDFLLKLTTSQGKTELTAMLLEYGNSNGNKKSPLDDLKWD